MKRVVSRVVVAAMAIGGLLAAGLFAYSGTYGFKVILRGEPMIWAASEPGDTRLSPSMRLALQVPPPAATAGAFTWLQIERGFEVAELPVIAGTAEVDRILLARIDPAHFRFEVRNRPSGDWDSLDWMRELGAVLVINGSYFTRYGTPATPLLSARVLSGPSDYDARHGAFVVSASFVGIRDLAGTDWPAAFQGADHALVSYPLLIATDGRSRSKGDARWLANRSFIGQDGDGRIILGTTKDAFFSLDRLAAFLGAAPLSLKLALNLDGGPIACQAVVLGAVFGPRRWGLPIALIALRR
jgi:Phosphodiester glycosidase